MPILPFVLTLTSACLHAFWHLQVRRSTDRNAVVLLAFLGALVLYLPACIYTWDQKLLEPNILLMVLISALTEIGYLQLILKAYQLGPLSVAYPIARGTSPIVVSLFSVFYFHESLSMACWGGIGFILLGMFLLSGFGTKSSNYPVLRVALLSILSGLNIGVYTMVDSRAILSVSPISYKYLSFIGITLFLLLNGLKKNHLKNWRVVVKANRLSILTLAFLSLFTYLIILYVMRYTQAAKVATLRETSSLISVIFGYWILKEKVDFRKWVGAVLVVLGIVFIKISS